MGLCRVYVVLDVVSFNQTKHANYKNIDFCFHNFCIEVLKHNFSFNTSFKTIIYIDKKKPTPIVCTLLYHLQSRDITSLVLCVYDGIYYIFVKGGYSFVRNEFLVLRMILKFYIFRR